MPDINKESELSGSDMARWTGLTAANKRQMMTTKPYPEIDVTQEMRKLLLTIGKLRTTTEW